MEQVLDVYKRPYDENNPVVCMDESPKQLISDARPSSPMKSGRSFVWIMNMSDMEWSIYSWQMSH